MGVAIVGAGLCKILRSGREGYPGGKGEEQKKRLGKVRKIIPAIRVKEVASQELSSAQSSIKDEKGHSLTTIGKAVVRTAHLKRNLSEGISGGGKKKARFEKAEGGEDAKRVA